jgi:sporulation integral membrane protein YtvI
LSPSLEKALMTLLKTVIILLAGAGIYFFVQYFWPLLSSMISTSLIIALPLLFAYLVAVLLNPVINIFENKLHLSRTLGTLISLVLFLTMIGGVVYLLVFNLISEMVDLSVTLSTYSNEWNHWSFNNVIDKFQVFLERLHIPSQFVKETMEDFWKSLDVVRDVVGVLLSQFLNFIKALPQYFILLVVTLIASFFFARDYQQIKANVSGLIIQWMPDKWEAGTRRVGQGLQRALHGYIRAILILISITGFLTLIGLSILGVRYAFILALLMALLDLLPIVGPGTVFIPWALLMFLTGSPGFGIGLLILYGILVIVRQMLEPKVVGEHIGLHPLTTLVSLYLGFTIFGFWGLILGPAVVIIYKAFEENN